jgi:hypothetical protein
MSIAAPSLENFLASLPDKVVVFGHILEEG